MVFLINMVLWTIVASAPLDYSYHITRDYFGDVFTISKHHCEDSDCQQDGRFAASIPGEGCTCQCAPTHYIYRDDLDDCVEFITECPLTMFLRPYIADKLPVVSLPLTGQLVYPGALFQFPEIGNLSSLSACEVMSTEFMTPSGWKHIFQEGSSEPVFGAYQDGSKTFLQWLGRDSQRHQLQHRLMLVRLRCQDKNITFESCSALKIGWSPGLDVAVTEPHWVRRNNFIIIGLCVGILGLTYIFAICIYMKVRRSKHNRCNDRIAICNRQSAFRDLRNQKENSRNSQFAANISRSSWNNRKQSLISERYPTSTYISDEEPDYPNSDYLAKQSFVLSEEYFEPEMLASPPPLAAELLNRVRQTIALSSRRLKNLRFKPTLVMIPEDDYFYPEDHRETRISLENARQQTIVETIRGPIPRSIIEHNQTPPCPPPRKYRFKQKQNTQLEGQNNKFDMFRQDLYQKLLHMNDKTDMDNILEGEEKFDESESLCTESKISRRSLLKKLELKNDDFSSSIPGENENIVKEQKLESISEENVCKQLSNSNVDVEALYKQWSNQVALKLLEQRVPNIECEAVEKETGILGQFLKEFKSAIGRIGHSNLPKSDSCLVGENWTLKREVELMNDKSLAQLLSLRSRLSEPPTTRKDSLTDISDLQDSHDSLTSTEDFKGDSETSGISSCEAVQPSETSDCNGIVKKNENNISIDTDSLESAESASLNSSMEESNEDTSESSLNEEFSRNRAMRGLEIVQKLKEVKWQHVCEKKYRVRKIEDLDLSKVVLDHNDNEMKNEENKQIRRSKRPLNGTCKDHIKHRKTSRTGEFCLDQNEFRSNSEISGDGYVTLIAVSPSKPNSVQA
ncbi:uncharacterized protein LOC111629237 isoform X1 [Centruroides sculpturatus]|uniref:uncharacterized protein LOC111629237 isoform X1 n=1 Tax=Centruroides sculpturatus TaxID=218467 RepID=UPI000C6DA583|nr:uncharacterized protein LOC111629237 isoform X1 [Centruroides sculpturatus]XP_023228882.1 uncharacterized protein LOC111629237 isoform X1 [Centruroides sculpturatus]XP_023228883.1 uncharacterized protein LOC111629237 isoform X1 [Centruroides sculpturatus]